MRAAACDFFSLLRPQNNNYLSSIPVSCLDLPNLKELNLEFNVLKASNAVDMLLQCASFCTSLQSLCIGANRFEHRDIQSKINETWLSIDALLKENPQVMSAMCYSELELKKMPDKKRLKRGLSACTVVKIFAAAAAEKHQTLLSDSMAAGPGNYKSLLNPDHAVVHVSSLLKTLTESSQPDAFSLLTLNLSGCNLSSSIHPMLIGVLQRLPSLIELDLSLNSLAGDRVTAILSGASTSLQSLKMCNSGISASSFSSARRALNFISLQHLDVSDNMELLSSGFIFLLQSCAAPKLIHLEASNCGIDLRTNEDYLPNVLSFFHRTTSLTNLNLSKNCIGVVVLEKILRHMSPDPQNFGRPSCANSATLLDSSRVVSNSWISPLQILDFSCTACDDCLPNSSQHFDNWLDSVFIHYSNLTRLLLSDNHHIFNIQPGVAHLRRLTFLDLSNCINLLNICEVLFAENEGRNFELKLVGCDALENPPKSVIEKGLVAIRKHISNEKVQQQSVELRHVKAIFLGNDAAARRSLLCSLANFRESDVKSFDEINQLIREQHVAGKSFLSKAFSRDNRPNVSFWNFCGELECCTHFNFFLSAYQSIYIILFNVSDSPDVVVQQLSYWLRAVFDTGGLQHSIRIFLVGTHFDQVPQSRLDSCTYLIDNLLMAMGIFYPFRSQISLKWWSSTNPLKWLGFCQPSDTDATIHSVLDTIFDTSEKILSKGNGTLHFPIMYERMLDEVKRLAQNCQESKSMPLVKLSELTEAQGFRVLAGSHRNLRRLDAVKICSEVGILIHFKDIKDDEDWIGVNLNFCLDVVMYFTNYVMTLKSTSLPLNRCILSKHEMYQIVTNVFQSAAPTVSWYASSLAQSYPESLFGFFVTQTLLLPVDSRHIQLHSGDAYGFMVPMLLKPRPHSWRAIFGHLFSGHLVQDAAVASWGFGMPIRIKASRYTSASQESLITVSKFLKLMLSKCFDYRHMWDASFLYHVEGTSIFVRLAEDRLGVDIVTIGSYAASIPAKVSREIQDIALNLEFRDRQAKRICPRCCVTDQYLKSGLNRVFFEQQLDHYKEYGISGTCYFDHEVEASSLEEGEKLIMPAAPEPEGPFFSGIAISSIDSL